MFIKDIGLYLSFLVISLSGEGSSKTLSRTKKGVSEYLGEGLSASSGQHGLGDHLGGHRWRGISVQTGLLGRMLTAVS